MKDKKVTVKKFPNALEILLEMYICIDDATEVGKLSGEFQEVPERTNNQNVPTKLEVPRKVPQVATYGDECIDRKRVIRVSSKKYQKEPKRIKKEQLKVTKKVAKN